MFLLINVIHDAGPIARNDVIVDPCGYEYGYYPLNGGTSVAQSFKRGRPTTEVMGSSPVSNS